MSKSAPRYRCKKIDNKCTHTRVRINTKKKTGTTIASGTSDTIIASCLVSSGTVSIATGFLFCFVNAGFLFCSVNISKLSPAPNSRFFLNENDEM